MFVHCLGVFGFCCHKTPRVGNGTEKKSFQVSSPAFETFIMGAIVVNTLFLALSLDQGAFGRNSVEGR